MKGNTKTLCVCLAQDIFVSIDHTLAGSLTVSVETAGLQDLLGQWEGSETKL